MQNAECEVARLTVLKHWQSRDNVTWCTVQLRGGYLKATGSEGLRPTAGLKRGIF
jgi:hypothetical protein